jgi:hypothetical protein
MLYRILDEDNLKTILKIRYPNSTVQRQYLQSDYSFKLSIDGEITQLTFFAVKQFLGVLRFKLNRYF